MPIVLSQPSTSVTPDTAEHSPEESTESQGEQEFCSESAVEECVTEHRYPLRDGKLVGLVIFLSSPSACLVTS